MSRREESESALRKDMFQTIIASFVNANARGATSTPSVLNLELLAYNFHESLNLKPLFIDMQAPDRWTGRGLPARSRCARGVSAATWIGSSASRARSRASR